MKISLIIPCFNSEKYLQSLAEWLTPIASQFEEVIFVDDGSTDDSSRIFRFFFSDSIMVSQENKGLAAARNAGVARASGDYIQFLDCDDKFSSNKAMRQLTWAARTGADVVYSDWQMVLVDEDGRLAQGPLQTGAASGEILTALVAGWWQPFHSYLIKRSAYHCVGGGDESLVNAQDYDLLIRMAAKGCVFEYCPGPISKYYRFKNEKSLARGDRYQYFIDYEKSTLRLLSRLEKEVRIDKYMAEAFSTKLHYIARNLYALDRARFKKLARIIRNLDPTFRPPGSWKYRMAYQLMGMQCAEAFIRFAKRI